jgi:glycosyltransferase involved in cell wall biosynthesis
VSDAKFTLVIPSYNGGDYLKQCLESVWAQTYTHFTVAVLDDGSTDGSLEWLRGLNDSRLTVYPTQVHLGIVSNWARALEVPKAEFMTILGQDDLLDLNYLFVMDALTQAHPEAGLYHAHFRFITARGTVMRSCRPLPERETAGEYLTALFTGKRDTYGTGYLMRSARYEAVGGILPFEKLLFADDALWMALMEGSYKATALGECFSCRLHPASASGGTEWQSWLAALPPYAAFLHEFAARDTAFESAWAASAPGYFENWGRLLYTLALTQATRQGKRVDLGARPAIAATLAQIAPALPPAFDPSPKFAAGWGMRAREAINRYGVTRAAYNAYVRGRYGLE